MPPEGESGGSGQHVLGPASRLLPEGGKYGSLQNVVQEQNHFLAAATCRVLEGALLQYLQ